MAKKIKTEKEKLDEFEEGRIDGLESEEIIKKAVRDEKLKKIIKNSDKDSKISKTSPRQKIILLASFFFLFLVLLSLFVLYMGIEKEPSKNNTLNFSEEDIPLLVPVNEELGSNVSLEILDMTCSNKSLVVELKVLSGNLDGVEFTLLLEERVEKSDFLGSLSSGDSKLFEIELSEEIDNISKIERLSVAGIIGPEKTITKAVGTCN